MIRCLSTSRFFSTSSKNGLLVPGLRARAPKSRPRHPPALHFQHALCPFQAIHEREASFPHLLPRFRYAVSSESRGRESSEEKARRRAAGARDTRRGALENATSLRGRFSM